LASQGEANEYDGIEYFILVNILFQSIFFFSIVFNQVFSDSIEFHYLKAESSRAAQIDHHTNMMVLLINNLITGLEYNTQNEIYQLIIGLIEFCLDFQSQVIPNNFSFYVK